MYISRTPGANAEIEALKKAVALEKKKAAAEQALREKHDARVVEAERELQEAVGRNESLGQSLSLKKSELAQAVRTANEVRVEAQTALKDIEEAWKIAAGRGFIFLFKAPYAFTGKIHGDPLNPNFFRGICGLPRSISDAAQFCRAEKKDTADKLVWSQYLAPNYPVSFVDQLKQLVELH